MKKKARISSPEISGDAPFPVVAVASLEGTEGRMRPLVLSQRPGKA